MKNWQTELKETFEKSGELLVEQAEEIKNLKAEIKTLQTDPKEKEAKAATPKELETAFKNIRI